jgi:hypothetical protein
MNRVAVPARQATKADGIDSLESLPGLLNSLKIPSQSTSRVTRFSLLETTGCLGVCL